MLCVVEKTSGRGEDCLRDLLMNESCGFFSYSSSFSVMCRNTGSLSDLLLRDRPSSDLFEKERKKKVKDWMFLWIHRNPYIPATSVPQCPMSANAWQFLLFAGKIDASCAWGTTTPYKHATYVKDGVQQRLMRINQDSTGIREVNCY